MNPRTDPAGSLALACGIALEWLALSSGCLQADVDEAVYVRQDAEVPHEAWAFDAPEVPAASGGAGFYHDRSACNSAWSLDLSHHQIHFVAEAWGEAIWG